MTGRWPANVILSPEMAKALDEQSGTSKSPPVGSTTNTKPRHSGSMENPFKHPKPMDNGYGDEGGASRFFLQAGYEPWELEWIIANGLTPCGLGEVEG